MLTCRDLIEFIADYLDGTLPEQERALFDSHLSLCVHCREYLDSYKLTILMSRIAMQADADEQDSPVVPEEVVRAVLAARGKSNDQAMPSA